VVTDTLYFTTLQKSHVNRITHPIMECAFCCR